MTPKPPQAEADQRYLRRQITLPPDIDRKARLLAGRERRTVSNFLASLVEAKARRSGI